jgi:hypothetical protein
MKLPVYDKGFTEEEIEFGFEQFLSEVNHMVGEHRRTEFPTLPEEHITVAPGRVYWKLVKEHVNGGGQKFVYAFVRKADGAILKSASWRAPALNHARGFVTDSDHGVHCAGVYGIRYMSH